MESSLATATEVREVTNMSETKKVTDAVEISLAYLLSAAAAILAFLLVWLIWSVAGSYPA